MGKPIPLFCYVAGLKTNFFPYEKVVFSMKNWYSV